MLLPNCGKMKDCKQREHKFTERHFPFLSSQDGEEGDMVQDLIEENASMEEVLSHPGASPKMSFRFGRNSQLPSEKSVSSEHQWDHSITPKNRRYYCILVRVILGDGGGNRPHCPMHGEDAWSQIYYRRPGQKIR